ncbi:BRCT domain-containing protein, partial [Enterococcus faecium]
GDFVVALYTLKTKSNRQHNLIASSHLEPVYKAIQKAVNWALPPVTFIDFDIKKGLLSAFTNKFFLRFDSFKELQLLRKYI